RKDPQYVPRAKAIQALEYKRRENPDDAEVQAAMAGYDARTTGLGSLVMAIKPGDGSAREQAASCQRVLGGCANLCQDFATKRYRSNVINWGMLPFTVDNIADYKIQPGDRLYVPGVRQALESGAVRVDGLLLQNGKQIPIALKLENLTQEDREIILKGCLINYYA
ncbi:MAG: hydratase, partial [Clostridiales bacterium]|nr:hydratase [Clostridiales bacterium]